MVLPSQSPPFPIARFTVEKYHRMIEAGAFTADDRVELIEGWVVKQMAKGPAHTYSTRQIDRLLSACMPPGLHVRNQEPITLETSEPEPDIAVVRGAELSYRVRHPHAGEVALVVEVADSSLETDRLKGRVYGRAGVPQYWIVNIIDRCVEIYTLPSDAHENGYASADVIRDGGIDLAIDGVSLAPISIAEILP